MSEVGSYHWQRSCNCLAEHGCRTSRRLRCIASDSQIWKSLYYERFVRPRASKLPGVRDPDAPHDSLIFSSRLSKWLDEECLVARGRKTNWKRQYKLRHNWSRGSCDISEIDMAEKTLIPPLLVQLYEGVVVSAESTLGLRAWSIRDRKLQATAEFHPDPTSSSAERVPQSLAINACQSEGKTILDVVVGLSDGTFGIYILDEGLSRFSHCYNYPSTTKSPITAITISDAYIVTLTELGLLSLYQREGTGPSAEGQRSTSPPRLLSSLRSHTTWPPSSLSLRPRSQEVVVSIAYALPTHLSGWSVGLQELHLSHDGEIRESRLASALDHGFKPLSSPLSPPESASPSLLTTQSEDPPPLSKPTSLSYNHPYLLASHPDNTLTLYMVHSTAAELSVSAGNRLWGHTSAVSGAYVGSRGRAVSVSSRGDELRIWELEGGMRAAEARRKAAGGDLSVQVRPEQKPGHCPDPDETANSGISALEPASWTLRARTPEPAPSSRWIGFDDERVVLLRQQGLGRGALVIYDFT